MNMKTILMILFAAFVIIGMVAELTGSDDQSYQDDEFLLFADNSFAIIGTDLNNVADALEAGDYVRIYSAGSVLCDHAQSGMMKYNDYKVSEDVKPLQHQYYEMMTEYALVGSYLKSAAENMEDGNMIKADEDFKLAMTCLNRGSDARETYVSLKNEL
ncbi:hypothetical protein [Methanococcoides sp. AM1]|uniref:hypothetical protein n=1 Tax=Methanococcoides sp. AM1 TaxID=1201011 RepID=UPI0010834384|nr:hypothetical protein [Methanococcoides sp. AM1]